MLEGTDQLQGQKLKQALEEYKSGKFAKTTLRKASLKQRKNFSIRFENFFASRGWTFNLQTAQELLKTFEVTIPKRDKHGKLTGNGGKPSAKSSYSTYVAKLRSFNAHCVKMNYLTTNFCMLLSKPPEDETHPEPVHMDIDFEVFLQAIKIGTTPSKHDRPASIFAKKESYDKQYAMFHMGHRIGGMSKLKGSDIHFEAEKPYVVIELKGGKRKAFLIPNDDELRQILYKRRSKSQVFEVSPETTIKHLRAGLRAQGIQEEILKQIDNHTWRRAYVKERHRNGESDQAIGDSIGDTAETIRKYYLADDPEASEKTINNSRAIRHRQPLVSLFDTITEYARTVVSRDDRIEAPRASRNGKYFTLVLPITELGQAELKKA